MLAYRGHLLPENRNGLVVSTFDHTCLRLGGTRYRTADGRVATGGAAHICMAHSKQSPAIRAETPPLHTGILSHNLANLMRDAQAI